jgi:hypothetical protein
MYDSRGNDNDSISTLNQFFDYLSMTKSLQSDFINVIRMKENELEKTM